MKRRIKLGFILALIAKLCLNSCKPHNGELGAETQHRFKKTGVKRKTPLKPCKENAKIQMDPKLSLSNVYLEKMVNFIVSANQKSSSTFDGHLSRSQFCTSVVYGTSMEVSGDTYTGLITASSRLFELGKTDAEIAFVVSHELAHITLNNSLTTRTFEEKIPKNERDLYDKLATASEIAYANIFESAAKLDAIYDVNPSGSYDENKPYAPQFRILLDRAIKEEKCKSQCIPFLALGQKLENAFAAYGLALGLWTPRTKNG